MNTQTTRIDGVIGRLLLFVLLAILAVVVYINYLAPVQSVTPEIGAPAATSAEPAIDESAPAVQPKYGQEFGHVVEDKRHCASGQAWEWVEPVVHPPTGKTVLILKAECRS